MNLMPFLLAKTADKVFAKRVMERKHAEASVQGQNKSQSINDRKHKQIGNTNTSKRKIKINKLVEKTQTLKIIILSQYAHKLPNYRK